MRLDLSGDFEQPVRLCVLTADEDHPAPGSVVRSCAECDAPVWVDMSQQLIHPETRENLTGTELYLCFACFVAHLMLNPEHPIKMGETRREEENDE